MKIRALLLAAAMCAGVTSAAGTALEQELEAYAADKDAVIGVAVVTDDGEVTGINTGRAFPMCSVMKFPLAIAVAEHADSLGITLAVAPEMILPDTYSPMREVYGSRDTTHISLRTLLDYSVRQSDNNACDILLQYIGGTGALQEQLERLGYGKDIVVRHTEADMHADVARTYENTAIPAAMAALLRAFDSDSISSPAKTELRHMMENCATGLDRIPSAFPGAVVGHKTGTGDTGSNGRIISVCDAAYVHLPDGRCVYLAVFIQDSPYGLQRTSAMIGEIASIVARSIYQ